MLGSHHDDLPSSMVIGNVMPYGLFNLDHSKDGILLIFIPVDLNNPGTLSVSEIRVWSTPSLPALQGSISNTYVNIIGPSVSYN